MLGLNDDFRSLKLLEKFIFIGFNLKKVVLRDNKQLEFKNNIIILNDIFFLHQENSGQTQFEYLIGNKILSNDNINIFKSNIKENERISKEYNFKYKHIIFPIKPVAYIDEFFKIGINIKRIVTEECIKINSVYYPNFDKKDYHDDDAHSNVFGQLKVINKICSDFNLKNFHSVTYKEEMVVGELSKMYDNNQRKRTSADNLILEKNEIIKNKNKKKVYIKKYSLAKVYKGNAGMLSYSINPLAINNKRIVLFGDSFLGGSFYLFSNLFNEVIFMRVPYIYEDIIKVLKPDIVLTSNAERYLVDMPDALNPKPYFLNYFTPKFKSNEIDNETVNMFNILFSGRESKPYKKFKKNKKLNIKDKLLNNIYKLTADDLISEIDINICRDKAIELENSDINKAYHLMKIVYTARSNPHLKRKLLEYTKKINEKC